MKGETMRFDVLRFGLALGILWGVGVFLTGLLAMSIDMGSPIVELLGSVYYGYAATFGGSLVGGIWGFLDGFIGGVIFAWLYNNLGCCCNYFCDSKPKSKK